MAIQISGTTVIDNSRNFIGTGLTVTQVYAQGNVGAAGSVLTSTGSGIQWSKTTSTGSIVVCELLVIGGGGSVNDFTYSGNTAAHGGGGGGQFVEFSGVRVLSGQSITVVVGGAQSQSSFGGLVAEAGQKGGERNEDLPSTSGGSGGGAGSGGSQGNVPGNDTFTETAPTITSSGASVYSRSTFASQGGNDSGGQGGSGGGGGAGGAGGNALSANVGGTAGVGKASSITGSSVTYSAGGDGSPANIITNGTNGTANTGNGGGGCGRNSAGTSTGGLGGSGIVIVAYPDTYPAPSSITGTYNEPTRSGWRVYRFTGSGTITL